MTLLLHSTSSTILVPNSLSNLSLLTEQFLGLVRRYPVTIGSNHHSVHILGLLLAWAIDIRTARSLDIINGNAPLTCFAASRQAMSRLQTLIQPIIAGQFLIHGDATDDVY